MAEAPKPYIISCDTHINEPPDLFTSRFPRSMRKLAPVVERKEKFDQWVVEGKLDALPVVAAARCGDRFLVGTDEMIWRQRLEDVRDFCHTPELWLKEVEKDGIWGAAILPSLGLMLFSTIESSDVFSMACQVYNDWILEFVQVAPERLRPIAMINLDDIGEAMKEAERVIAAGAGGLMIPTTAPADRPYGDPEYDPFWEMADALQIPLNLHVGVDRNYAGADFSIEVAAGVERLINQSDEQIRMCLMQFIFGQVFKKHPGLKVVSVENEGSWALHFLQAMDWHWKNNLRFIASGRRFESDMLPSDYFRQNVKICFTHDKGLLRIRDMVGVDNLVWGDDFPHAESTYPHSAEILDDLFDGVPDEVRHQILVTNAASLYNIEVPAALTAATPWV